MKKFTIYSDDAEFCKKDRKRLQKAMKGFAQTELPLAVEFVFVDEEGIRTLNNKQRKIDKVTDVLSFPAYENLYKAPILKGEYGSDIDEKKNLLIGSVVVCKKRAKEQAEEFGHSYQRELHYLLVHGIMHCFGFDHEREEDKALMRQMEESVLLKLGITREEEVEA